MHVMNLIIKGFRIPLHWLMGLMAMAGARNWRLKTSPDGDAVRVCEGSSSKQAILRITLVEPQPVTREPACHGIR